MCIIMHVHNLQGSLSELPWVEVDGQCAQSHTSLIHQRCHHEPACNKFLCRSVIFNDVNGPFNDPRLGLKLVIASIAENCEEVAS